MAPEKSKKEKESPVTSDKDAKTAEKENLAILKDLVEQLSSSQADKTKTKTKDRLTRIPKSATCGSTVYRSPLAAIDEENEWGDNFGPAQSYDPSMSIGFVPYPPFYPPHVGFGPALPPMPMVEPSEADEQGDEDDDMTDEDVEPPTIDPNESVDDETSDTQGDLLSLVRERYADEDGPAVDKELAGIVNTIWRRGRDPNVLKNILTKYHRPKNIDCHKVDLNPEIITGLPKPVRSRDMKLRAAQGSVARACVPAIHIAEAMIKN